MSLPEYKMCTLALSLRELTNLVLEGDLNLNAPYQRGNVWTQEQRVNLLRSLLLGVPVAAIVLNRRGSNTAWTESGDQPYYVAIDGKQRLTTGLMWFGGDLAIPTDWLRAEFLPADFCESTVTFKNLVRAGQLWMARNFVIPIAEAQLPSVAAEAEVYGLINAAGTPQTEEDLARARALARK
jgi:hypothetical protein